MGAGRSRGGRYAGLLVTGWWMQLTYETHRITAAPDSERLFNLWFIKVWGRCAHVLLSSPVTGENADLLGGEGLAK
jgi:hypothetical protein